MAETQASDAPNPIELLSTGRRHLAVKNYSAAVESLAEACEQLAKAFGDTADQCAEAYLWYGKSLLGLAREDSGVLGDGVPGTKDTEDDDDDEDDEDEDDDDEESEDEPKGKVNGSTKKAEAKKKTALKVNGVDTSKTEASSSAAAENKDQKTNEGAGSSADAKDESVANLEEDDVDNLQLAWEMLDLSRSILSRRAAGGGGDAAKALLADAHLALGEVALESETYDKAVLDLQSCLELQKELYTSDDRRIAETHYQIGLAHSLASNFDEGITHFKNAANIIESRIKTLENPTAAAEDATVKKYSADPHYSIAGEVQELKQLLPEIQEKIQDMMDFKAETLKRVRETLCPSNAPSSSNGSSVSVRSMETSGSSSQTLSSTASTKPASDISHLIKRKRKSSGDEEGSAAKRANK